MSKADIIPPQPMEQNRLLTRYLLVIFLIPLLLSKLNEIWTKYQAGYVWTTQNILFDGIIIISYLAMLYFYPQLTPIFENTYIMTQTELRMTRFLKPGKPIKINEISRLEFYKNREKEEKEEKEQLSKIYHERVAELVKTGFKREDFTNSSENIIIILSKEKFYQMTPLYPKTFIDKMRKHKPDLLAKQIEMTENGKRETRI